MLSLVDELRSIVEQQRSIVEQQQQLITELRARPAGPVIQHANIEHANIEHANINMNFTINNFGSEDISYLDAEVLRRRCLQRMNGIIATIKDVHMNKEHPENNNVRMVSRRHKLAAIREGGEWKQEPVSVVVDKLIWNGHTTNMRHHEEPNVDETEHDADLANIMDFQTWCYDINDVKQHKVVQKGPVIIGRQQVRGLVLQQPAPEAEAPAPAPAAT